jgi:hypothetical protein
MKLVVNTLIQWVSATAPRIERILYLDHSGGAVPTIDVQADKGVPEWHSRGYIEEALRDNRAVILQHDHVIQEKLASFGLPRLTESQLNTPKYKNLKKVRDRAWHVIGPLVSGENAVRMLCKKDRSRLINQRVKELRKEAEEARKRGDKKIKPVDKGTVYDYCRQWWQGGQHIGALLPGYLNCGARRGKPRNVHGKKLGRPARVDKHRVRDKWVNVDDKWRAIIEKGGDLFYNPRERKAWKRAYRRTLETFCPKGYKVVNGVKEIVLPNSKKGEIFSLDQFKYHYKLHVEKTLKESLIRQYGVRRFNLNYRELVGKASSQAFGPGSYYELDATLADVYLVSLYDPAEIIGRPVIYAVVDVFSDMVVGFCIRWEGESALSVQLALENVTTDKVAFCAKYGVEITEEMWPTSSIGEALCGDGGPLKGEYADHIARAFNLDQQNTPPYRPDWKGTIEQVFNLMNIAVFHGLPGAVEKDHQRGDKDYRLASTLNIHDLYEIVIRAVLVHNRRRLTKYEPDAEMIADKVKPIPLELFKWGVENRTGHLRCYDPEYVRINLLPSASARVTEDGIAFGGNLYTCDLAEREGWRLIARNMGRWDVEVAYDPRPKCNEVVYLRPSDGSPSIPCHLIDPNARFKDWDLGEIEHFDERYKLDADLDENRMLQDESDLEAHVKNITQRAKKRRDAALAAAGPRSDSSRVEGMRERRKNEVEATHRDEAAELRAKVFPHGAATEGSSSGGGDTEQYVPIPDIPITELFEEVSKDDGAR